MLWDSRIICTTFAPLHFNANKRNTMFLHNRVSKKELRKRVAAEPFSRTTISFYRYVYIANPNEFRDHLFAYWQSLNILGRIYIAHEGINAQMSVPDHNVEQFLLCSHHKSEKENCS